MAKPTPLAQCIKGKAIGAVRNFCETFNWMAKFLYYLSTDGSVEINESSIDHRKLGIAGFSSAEDGAIPVKSGESISWFKSDTDLEVVTGLSFSFTNGKLECTLEKKKIVGAVFESLEDSSVDVAHVVNTDVVVNTSYNDDGNNEFKQKKISGVIFANSSSTTTETVFLTSLHQ